MYMYEPRQSTDPLCALYLLHVPEYQVVFVDISTSALLNMHTYMYAFVSVIGLGLFYLV